MVSRFTNSTTFKFEFFSSDSIKEALNYFACCARTLLPRLFFCPSMLALSFDGSGIKAMLWLGVFCRCRSSYSLDALGMGLIKYGSVEIVVFEVSSFVTYSL